MSYIQSNPTLRAYQQEGVSRVLENLLAGRHTVLVAPTGSGKTVMAAEITKHFKNVLFLAHRRELIAQARAATDGATVHAETVQSWRKIDRNTVDLLVIDEAHRSAAPTYKRIIAKYPHAVRLGLTATPRRNDGESLAGAFDEIVETSTTSDLVSQGHLVPSVIFEAPDEALSRLAALRSVAGDYDSGELSELMNQPRLVGNVVREYLKHAYGRKSVVFAVTVKHSIALTEAFVAAGVRAVHLDGKTKHDKRAEALREIETGGIDVICNVNLFTEGWDCPPVSCVIMARPTQSLTLYLQCVGRGMRPSDGKSDLIILDHAGNVERHGAPDERRIWSLETIRQKREREAREAKELRVREWGYASLEEYELQVKRLREETYTTQQLISKFNLQTVTGSSVRGFFSRRGVEPLPGIWPLRFRKQEIDKAMAHGNQFYSQQECQEVLKRLGFMSSVVISKKFLQRKGYTGDGPHGKYLKSEVDDMVNRLDGSIPYAEFLAEFKKRSGFGVEAFKKRLKSSGIKRCIPVGGTTPRYRSCDVERFLIQWCKPKSSAA